MRATRQLLNGSAASLAVAVCCGPLAAASPSLFMLQAAEDQAGTGPYCGSDASVGSSTPIRLFFLADVHSDHETFDRIVQDANRDRPTLVLEGGDMVHDGTRSEFRRAFADRERLEPPWHLAKGNHDARRDGDSADDLAPAPDFKAFTCRDVRFILLDNHQERISEDQFRRLEAELEEHRGKRIVVAMHVPPTVSHEPLIIQMRHLVPFDLASPTMKDSTEVARFTDLMSRHQVLAVLSAHTHYHDDQSIDGVRYVVTGTAGGLQPGLGVPSEYLDIEIHGRDLKVRRVLLHEPAGDPLTYVARAFRFIARVNSFSHAAQGWNFVPSSSVQSRGGARLTETRDGDIAALLGVVSFERVLGDTGRRSAFADLGLSAAPREVAGQLTAGYKLRPIGDYNRNAYGAVGGTLNMGILQGSGTAGAGAMIEVGVEWRAITVGLRRDRATNHRSTSLVLGRRF